MRLAVYLGVFPELLGNPEGLLDLVALEVQLRREAGEQPTAREYIEALPDLANELEKQFALEACLEDLQSSTTDYPSEHPLSDDAVEPPTEPPPSESPVVPLRFRILRRLGGGGFGEVWLARDREMKRHVALKFPKQDRDHPESLARFHREAELAAGVNHPNLCTLHERFWDHSPPFLVLDYINGRTLQEELEGQQSLDIGEAVEILGAVVAGVSHAHQRGIIHRDLKPANIKIREDEIVKVLDFGLAKPILASLNPVTRDGRIVGTRLYMAPEQLAGAAVGPAADQFALGVILYQMLTGTHPFLVENDPEYRQTLRRIERCCPTPPRERCPEIDPALNSIVLRMMAKNPADRFASLKEVQERLSAYQKGNRVPVPLPRTGRRLVTVLAACAYLLLSLGMVSVWPRHAQEPPPRVEKPTRQAPADLPGLLDLIHSDLGHFDIDDQPFYRYFSLAHLRNDPQVSPEQLQQHRDALTQLLPALYPGDPVVPQPVDVDGTVYRLDLRTVHWSRDPHWRQLQRNNPYALQFPPGNTNRELRNLAGDIYRKTGEVDGRLPAFVRVDWLLVTFTDPERARQLLALAPFTPEQTNERLQRIAALRERTAEVRALFARPIDLDQGCRELGLLDRDQVRQAILASPRLADDLGLRPLTDGKCIDRTVWAGTMPGGVAFGELAAQLKLGRWRWVP